MEFQKANSMLIIKLFFPGKRREEWNSGIFQYSKISTNYPEELYFCLVFIKFTLMVINNQSEC